MKTKAYEFHYAVEAGLRLSGMDKDHKPEWIGTQEQFTKAVNLIKLHELIN